MGRITLSQLVKGGAVRMVCCYHGNVKGGDSKWVATLDFARREFRSASPRTISALISRCKAARAAAKGMDWTYRSDAKVNGGRKKCR